MIKTANKIFRAVRRRQFIRLLSVVVLSILAYQLYDLAGRLNWTAFAAALARPGRWRWLLAALVLMPLNWLLEARKWQLLLNPFLRWPFGRVLRATLAGVSISATTPNRVGEIGGRLLVARPGEWGGVFSSSLLGSFCQWIAFLLIAWPALVVTVGLPIFLLPLGALLIAGGWWAGKPLLLRLLASVQTRYKLSLTETIEAIRYVKIPLILRAGGYACLRFCVYCTQLYLLLWFFGLELPFLTGMAGIAAIYLVQAGVPLPPGVNLVARAELGLLLWGDAPDHRLAVLMAFTGLFAINVLLPALPGYWLIVRKHENYEEPAAEI